MNENSSLKALATALPDWLVTPTSLAVAVALFVLGGFFSGFLREYGKTVFTNWSVRRRGKRVFRESPSPLFNSKARHRAPRMRSTELIHFYIKETPYYLNVRGRHWDFAASLVIPPTGTGALRDQPVSFRAREQMFQLDPEILDWTDETIADIKGMAEELRLYDGRPWCMADLQHVDGGWLVDAQRCSYFDSLRTNFSMDVPILEGKASLRRQLHWDQRCLDSFARSRLPNHMGVVGIVESSDGKLVIQNRSKMVAIRPDTLSSSVSGTIEVNDLEGSSEPIPLSKAVRGLNREAFFELGLSEDTPDENIRFLGMIREFRRGGFPDFYFYIRSPKTFAEIAAASEFAPENFEFSELLPFPFHSDVFLTDPDRQLERFAQTVETLLDETIDKANLTLSLGIALTYEHILRVARQHEIR